MTEGSALARNRAATSQLSVVARKMRLSVSRRSKIYTAVGLRPRRTDIIFRWLSIGAVVLFLVVPNAISLGYYGLVASDQFESETRFTVSMSAPMVESDKLGEVSGIPSAKIVQDTQIVANFIHSRAMLETLEKEVGFSRLYTKPDIDWFARLEDDSSIEDRLEYWEDMCSVGIDAKSGIITVKVRAFNSEDSHAIVNTVVNASEKLINDLSDRIWNDVTVSAQGQVEKATAQIKDARAKLQAAQNKSGVLTVEGSATQLSTLLVQVEGEKITLENTYRTNLMSVSKDAPQMIVLANKIKSMSDQIDELRARLANQAPVAETLANVSSELSQLNLELRVAEQQLESSIAALEQIQFSSQQQLLYLDPFVAPTMAESAKFPRRWLWIGITLIGSLVAYGIAFGVLSVARDRVD